jgi:hypothetical protein
LGYPALLILLECYAINICATDISLKVISLQLKGYALTEQQFRVAWILLHSYPHNHWTKASMGINGWIFLKDCKPAFSQPPLSQNGWLINIIAVQHVWRTVKETGFKGLQGFLSNVPT